MNQVTNLYLNPANDNNKEALRRQSKWLVKSLLKTIQKNSTYSSPYSLDGTNPGTEICLIGFCPSWDYVI